MSQIEDNICQVHKLIVDNRCINVLDIANELEISISSIETIFLQIAIQLS